MPSFSLMRRLKVGALLTWSLPWLACATNLFCVVRWVIYSSNIAVNTSWHNSGGIFDLSYDPLRPCVPVLLPLGAEMWQVSPFLHIVFGFQFSLFVQISVGFILSSPYWQYVTEFLMGKPCIIGNFLKTPRGFSMYQIKSGLSFL
jgi:hypothetical protein